MLELPSQRFQVEEPKLLEAHQSTSCSKSSRFDLDLVMTHLHLCVWQMLLYKASYSAVKVLQHIFDEFVTFFIQEMINSFDSYVAQDEGVRRNQNT